MPGARRTKKGQTQVGKNAEIVRGAAASSPGGVQNYDGRKNTQSGDAPGTAGQRGELYVQGKAAVIDTA